MKDLKDKLNENLQINEVYFPYFPGTNTSEVPAPWLPYVLALYGLILIWYGVFAYFNDPAFGLKTLKEIIKGKIDDFKYKKELEEMKEVLENDEEFKQWKSNKKHKMKELNDIIIRLKDTPNVKRIIRDIWKESKI